jgi:hypothetical protein
MITRRLLILERLGALAGVIQKANGFDSDAGLRVYIGDAPELGPSDPDFAIAIVPGDELATEDGRISNTFPVEVQAIGKSGAVDAWINLELLLGDLKRAIELEDRTLGSILKGVMKRGPTRTLERPPGHTTIGAGIFYTCPYVDEWGNPGYGVPPAEET